MDTEALRRLRLDTRLRGRKGWATEEEFEQELARLPDVSGKIKPPEQDPRSRAEDGSRSVAPEESED